MADRQFKRGSSPRLTVTRKDAGGTAVDIAAQTVTATMKKGDATFAWTVAKPGATGVATLTATAAATAALDAGTWFCDVKYVDGAEADYSQTFTIEVLESFA